MEHTQPSGRAKKNNCLLLFDAETKEDGLRKTVRKTYNELCYSRRIYENRMDIVTVSKCQY